MTRKVLSRGRITVINILAVLAGVTVGSLVNMAIVTLSGSVIPPPEGADITTMEGLRASLHLFEPKHFLMPFLAHASGTFSGAIVAGMIARTSQKWFALGTGFFFLAGGIANAFMLPSPVWFTLVDLILAYLPVAYLGGKIAGK